METLKYTCVPSITCMVCKFEKSRSSYREKCRRAFLLPVFMPSIIDVWGYDSFVHLLLLLQVA